MTRTILATLLLIGGVDVLFAQRPSTLSSVKAQPKASKPVTGHYRLRYQSTSNRLEVLQMPDGQIKFHILALWISSYNRENVHNGEVQGIAELHGDTAVYQSDHCRISIKLTSTRAIVQQFDEAGDCDFGVNVTATGTYRKTDSRPPKFDF